MSTVRLLLTTERLRYDRDIRESAPGRIRTCDHPTSAPTRNYGDIFYRPPRADSSGRSTSLMRNELLAMLGLVTETGVETMPREARSDLLPGVFHVASHGLGDRRIFLDDFDRTSFLRLLGCVVYRFRWICSAYCLMSNHYHLIVDTDAERLSRGIQTLHSVHTRRFNSRHRRSGCLFRRHFMSDRIDDDYRFRNALKYIAINPVDAGICTHPGEWPWSSYSATAGTIRSPEFLSVQPVLSLFSQDVRRAQNTYIDFVSGSSPEVEREMKSRYYSSEPVASCRVRERTRPTLSELFDGCDSKDSRNAAIGRAYQVFGYTLAEIGEHVGLSESMVCKISRGVKGLNHNINNS